MSNQTIASLREHLFSAIEALSDKDNPMDIDRAKAISEIAQTIINSAKVEVEYIKTTQSKGSGFLENDNVTKTLTGTKAIENGVTTHKIR